MARDADGIIKQKFAETGDVGLGGLDLSELWPISYSTPGGAFPQRIQFNQLFRYLSALGVEINQAGPFLAYSNLIDYLVGAVVKGSDGVNYSCLVDNGPGSAIVDPVGDISGTWVGFLTGVNPIGTTISFNSEVPPAGYLEEDGSILSRTVYAPLFAAIGDKYGVGDGSTTFALDDKRGKFLRGWDHGAGNDPDAASRTDSGDGATIGDHVGTCQADQNKEHLHVMNAVGNHNHGVGNGGGTALVNYGEEFSAAGVSSQTSGSGGAHTPVAQNQGGDEARPINVNVMYCIKY